MANSSVPITAGSGTAIDTYQLAGGDHQQIVREAAASAESEVFWAASTSATTSVIAADETRVSVLILNNSTGRVWLRWDSTAPTSATNGHHWYLEPGERMILHDRLAKLDVSVIGQIANGHVVFHRGLAA